MPVLASSAIAPLGTGLRRPECVVGALNGDVYIPDWRGGVAVIRADGSQRFWLAESPGFDLRPNGIAFTPKGNFLIANLGAEGGVWEMGLDGGLTPFLIELDGRPLPPANFVYVDAEERVWITVSTRVTPRQAAWRRHLKDGFVVRVDRRGAAIVADNLHYTNEVRLDPTGRWLYVIETFGKRLVRFPLRADGGLGGPQTAAQFGDGVFPDGFAFDAEGGIWVTSLLSNRVVRLRPEGGQEVVIEELNADHVQAMQNAYEANVMPPNALGPIPGVRFQHLTSIAFGGPDRRRAWLGCLHSECIYEFRSEIPGASMPHWGYRLP
jgi:sugar lactone lactonase YvrE